MAVSADNIHWHDSRIIDIRLSPERDHMEMRILYPDDWSKNVFSERTVVFADTYGYKEFEGPFSGMPTVLEVEVAGSHREWTLIRMETSAGYREVYCKSMALLGDEES